MSINIPDTPSLTLLMRCTYHTNEKLIGGAVFSSSGEYVTKVTFYTKVTESAFEGDDEWEVTESFEDTYPDIDMAVGIYHAKILEFRNRYKI